jgi:hypothetical protein
MAITLNGDTGITTPAETIQGNLTTTGNTILGDASTDTLNVGNGGLVKDAAGNVGVGVPPSAWSSTYKAIQMGAGGSFSTGSSSITYSAIGANYFDNGASRYIGTGAATLYAQNAGQHIFYTAPSGTAGNAITFTQAMTLDASGNLLVGCTSQPGAGSTTTGCEFAASGAILVQRGGATPCYFGRSNDGEIMALYSGTTQRGTVSIAGATTTYGSFSDYRLKENIVSLTGAVAKVMALKPSTFNFIEFPEQTINGFVAHEVAEVEPIAVTGQKDAVDEEGKQLYQSIDPAKLVPLLTAAIQEQQAMIDELKAKVAALEAA